MTTPWKFAALSVVGTRHLKEGQDCADASHAFWDEELQTLVLVAADGAGSAKHGLLGAKYAVEAVTLLTPELLREKSDITSEELESLLIKLARKTRSTLEEKVRQENELEPVSDEMLQSYATTLLVVICTPNHLAALQIGDGFIIVTTPQPNMFKLVEANKGQYANQTCFLTSFASFDELVTSGHVKVSVRSSTDVCSLALITDGLETVAMNMKATTPHPPFFLEMMKGLWTLEPSLYVQKLERFLLEDETLNDKTDDDKTIVLALNTLQPQNFEASSYPVSVIPSEKRPQEKVAMSPRVITLSEQQSR
jgi:serine/threonine protein phosphatase PrpC